MGFPFKKLIGTAAPWIATAIGGPLAGQAVSQLTNALGLKADAKIDDVETLLNAGQLTGEQLVRLKEADQQFQQAMQLAGFADVEKLAELSMKDRDSARQREIQVRDITPRLLAAGVTIGFFGILLFMLLKDIPAAAHDVLMVMIGSLGTAWTAIISYYFGSSAGSAEKTQLLAHSTPAKD